MVLLHQSKRKKLMKIKAGEAVAMILLPLLGLLRCECTMGITEHCCSGENHKPSDIFFETATAFNDIHSIRKNVTGGLTGF